VLLDADRFKQVNDSYGYTVGDRVLQEISQVVQQTVLRSDIVGRYGGEEFVILLPETDAPTAFLIAERIRGRVAAQHLLIDQHQLAITISLGVATMQGGVGLNLNALLT